MAISLRHNRIADTVIPENGLEQRPLLLPGSLLLMYAIEQTVACERAALLRPRWGCAETTRSVDFDVPCASEHKAQAVPAM